MIVPFRILPILRQYFEGFEYLESFVGDVFKYCVAIFDTPKGTLLAFYRAHLWENEYQLWRFEMKKNEV